MLFGFYAGIIFPCGSTPMNEARSHLPDISVRLVVLCWAVGPGHLSLLGHWGRKDENSFGWTSGSTITDSPSIDSGPNQNMTPRRLQALPCVTTEAKSSSLETLMPSGKFYILARARDTVGGKADGSELLTYQPYQLFTFRIIQILGQRETHGNTMNTIVVINLQNVARVQCPYTCRIPGYPNSMPRRTITICRPCSGRQHSDDWCDRGHHFDEYNGDDLFTPGTKWAWRRWWRCWSDGSTVTCQANVVTGDADRILTSVEALSALVSGSAMSTRVAESVFHTLPETNIAHENPIFPGKYHQNCRFSMAMLVYRSVHQYNWRLPYDLPIMGARICRGLIQCLPSPFSLTAPALKK